MKQIKLYVLVDKDKKRVYYTGDKKKYLKNMKYSLEKENNNINLKIVKLIGEI